MSRRSFDLSNLRSARQINLARAFADLDAERAWGFAEPALAAFAIPDGTGGVNPGDRRAIFYLVLHLAAREVLEIGTHVGASTTAIASAQLFVEAAVGGRVHLDSVDICDVNDPAGQPWIGHGAPRSPRDMAEALGVGDRVRFVVQPSATYLDRCGRRYDVIFLDGDHSEETVYQEVALALCLLRPGGVILLHDYFPDARPLWSNGVVGLGPYLAVRRMREEGVRARALPLGALPWPTKCDSTVTSLAILVRESG